MACGGPLRDGASVIRDIPPSLLRSRPWNRGGNTGRQRLCLLCRASPRADGSGVQRGLIRCREHVRGGWGRCRWRGSVVDDDDIANFAGTVDLLDLAVADGVLMGRPLALARCGGRGHAGGIAVQWAIEGRVRVLGEQLRCHGMHGGLHSSEGGCRRRGGRS